MNCPQVERNLTAYLDGTLPVGQQEATRQHLLECPACSQLVEESRAFDQELRFAAQQIRRSTSLSRTSSVQIQENVYKRMRRALFVQRTVHVLQRGATALAMVAFVIAAVALLNPWRQQLASFSDTNPGATSAPVLATSAPEPAPTQVFSPTPLPTEPPAEALPETTLPEVILSEESPGEVARSLVDTAIEAEDADLRALLIRTQPLPEASYRVWRRLGSCQGQVSAEDLNYRVILHQDRFASIYVYDVDGQYLGDIKMWLHNDGYWYVASVNYSSFAALKYSCSS